jgi:alpha-galactosidase
MTITSREQRASLSTFAFGNDELTLGFEFGPDTAPRLISVATSGGARLELPDGLPLVDVLTVAHGHSLASGRLVHTVVGESLRYIGHETSDSAGVDQLTIALADPSSELAVRVELRMPSGVAGFTVTVEAENSSASADVVVRSITSWSTYLGSFEGGTPDTSAWELLHGYSDWLAEGRWASEPLGELRFPQLAAHLTGHNPRGARVMVSGGTWSTGTHQSVGVLSSQRDAFAWAWQINHNGAWRAEVGEDNRSPYFALSGPTDLDHQWTRVLHPGEMFRTVPVAISVGAGVESAIAELTGLRRAGRRQHPDNSAMPVVYNDYMNTLNGDPTTERLLPLIDAAAAVGAEIFCIDAGWYDDNHDWWDSVGEWIPSSTRFAGGFDEVVDRIRSHGMVPGLWLEPEVVGVRSPVADVLPEAAFLSRHGQRIVEQGRYHLDLRHPAAVRHLDLVVDRLVADFGIGYFKFDYNIEPGAGTDHDADSVGAALLDHNRAHLAWIDSVLERHPDLVLENCASGAMRSDGAMLSRMQLQSTSDQQDFLKYPPIAASAPMAMLPEQAANWAYPAVEMSIEEVGFCVALGVLGRFYLSGLVNRLNSSQREIVAEGVRTNRALRPLIRTAVPVWPIGLPEWSSSWVAFGLATPTSRHVTVWNRSEEEQDVVLNFPDLIGAGVSVRTIFPTALTEWTTLWDRRAGTLHVRKPAGSVGARTLELTLTRHDA